MRVAVVSNRNRPGFPDENLADHLRWIRKASSAGAKLVLFPELSLSGYTTADFVREIAMTFDDWRCQTLIRAAAAHDLHVSFGLPLRRGRRLYISHAIVGPDGVVGHYEKVHLALPNEGEGRVFTRSDTFRVFDVKDARIGINICFDGRHPGSILATAHLGAEIILHPHGNFVSDWLGNDPIDWTLKKQAYLGPRAIDTCTYTILCNSVGDVRDADGHLHHFSGGALVLGFDGEVLARSSSAVRRPHMVLADLDLAELRRRRASSFFAYRNPKAIADAFARQSDTVGSVTASLRTAP